MNYLAHIFLSGEDDFLKLGNFMADEIKGKSYKDYPLEIQRGILLHRAIDDFTDHHPLVYKGAHRFFNELRHYNGVAIDMIYDHILAKNWGLYCKKELAIYAEEFYDLLDTNLGLLPKRISKVVPYMIEHNWLVNYSEIEGLRAILKQMNNKTRHDTQLEIGVDIYLQNQKEYGEEFKVFFDDIQLFCQNKIKQLNTDL
jgi:acyl carrier protein phosphodiesterase